MLRIMLIFCESYAFFCPFSPRSTGREAAGEARVDIPMWRCDEGFRRKMKLGLFRVFFEIFTRKQPVFGGL